MSDFSALDEQEALFRQAHEARLQADEALALQIARGQETMEGEPATMMMAMTETEDPEPEPEDDELQRALEFSRWTAEAEKQERQDREKQEMLSLALAQTLQAEEDAEFARALEDE